MRRRSFHAALLILIAPSLACGFSEYMNRSKAAEASSNLRAICAGVSSYLEAERMEGGQVVTGQLPPAAARAPSTVPCGEQTMWSSGPEWDEIGFAPADPLYFSYEYSPDADGAGFTIRAIGDLDCDQTQSVYTLHGTVSDGVADCSGEIAVENEYE